MHYLDAAKDDIRKISIYISHKSGHQSIGLKFAQKLTEKCKKIAKSPILLGVSRKEIRPDLRSIPYGNYIIFFRHIEDNDILEIVRIIERHRDILEQFDIY